MLEQNKISQFLDKRLTQIEQIIEKNYQSLDLLKERRTALISAAVTGKIDVRNFKLMLLSSDGHGVSACLHVISVRSLTSEQSQPRREATA